MDDEVDDVEDLPDETGEQAESSSVDGSSAHSDRVVGDVANKSSSSNSRVPESKREGGAAQQQQQPTAPMGKKRAASASAPQQKYWLRRAGVAVADKPEGPFTLVHLLKPDGLPSLDLQLFQEDEVRTITPSLEP